MMKSALEIELEALAVEVQTKAVSLGFTVSTEVVKNTVGWMPFKLKVVGPSWRSQEKPEFKDDKQEGLFTVRQAKMLLKAHSLWRFWTIARS